MLIFGENVHIPSCATNLTETAKRVRNARHRCGEIVSSLPPHLSFIIHTQNSITHTRRLYRIMKAEATLTVYPKLNANMQQAFYTCFCNYGKISTKKLLASLVGTQARMVADEIVEQVQYENVPSRSNVVFHQAPPVDDMAWLDHLPLGPGVSPCVNRTCARLLRDVDEIIDELLFLQVLCATAIQLSRLVKQHQLDVPEMIARARVVCKTCE